MSKSRARRGAFTLIEACTVMAVVTVLLVLAGGAYSEIQRKVIDSSDLANLRQIGQGMHQYIGDNNGVIPPMGPTVCAQEYIARELGITVSLRATNVSPREWGPFISRADKGAPPKISPLRSYGVNFYVGEVTTQSDSRIAKRYLEINKPSAVLYFLPMKRETTEPSAQSRFSELTSPSVNPAGYIRVGKSNKTVALWADGHASYYQIPSDAAAFARDVFPKAAR